MIIKDYYKMLGLETNKVELDEIKTAYREQAKKYHPDVNVGDTRAEDRIKDINEAYNILSNPVTRKKYDRIWNSRIGKRKAKALKEQNKKEETSAKVEILKILFGSQEEGNPKRIKKKQNTNIPKQGENVETEIPISLQDAFFGSKKDISLRTVNGKMKTFEVTIPAGIRDGEKIRLIGQGLPGENGGKNGDLLIKVNIIKENKYKLIGDDVYTEISVTPWEAVLGTKINIDFLGETIGVYIPQGTTTGEEIKIPDKGYKNAKGGRGNLIISVKIMLSKKISNPEIDLYKKLAKISKFNPRNEYK